MYTVIAKPRSGCGNLSYTTMIFTRCHSSSNGALLHGSKINNKIVIAKPRSGCGNLKNINFIAFFTIFSLDCRVETTFLLAMTG
ncbi:hypothetical protein [Rickettsia endosymbiont of Ceutorhynchus obstrictus]|uniref:hypothetical protein n=1 Tax=Rickettsia endosymbiont of Ceutorhynchus obstrictus TaxID=3066249 RepID=UPI0031329E0D